MVPVIELTEPSQDDHSSLVRSFSRSVSHRSQIRLQVADPPTASRSEIDEARLKLPKPKLRYLTVQ